MNPGFRDDLQSHQFLVRTWTNIIIWRMTVTESNFQYHFRLLQLYLKYFEPTTSDLAAASFFTLQIRSFAITVCVIPIRWSTTILGSMTWYKVRAYKLLLVLFTKEPVLGGRNGFAVSLHYVLLSHRVGVLESSSTTYHSLSFGRYSWSRIGIFYDGWAIQTLCYNIYWMIA